MIPCHLWKVTVFLLPFWFGFFLFIYLFIYCLVTMARTTNAMLSKNGKSGHPCFVSDVRGNAFTFLPLSMLTAGLSYMTFIILRYVPSILTSLRVSFYHQWMLGFVKCFVLHLKIVWFFSLQLLKWCITLIYLHILNHPCIPGINTTWS